MFWQLLTVKEKATRNYDNYIYMGDRSLIGYLWIDLNDDNSLSKYWFTSTDWPIAYASGPPLGRYGYMLSPTIASWLGIAWI